MSDAVDKLIKTVRSNERMILRDDTIGAVWDKDENGKRLLRRLTADGDNYWAITTEELDTFAAECRRAKVETAKQVYTLIQNNYPEDQDKAIEDFIAGLSAPPEGENHE